MVLVPRECAASCENDDESDLSLYDHSGAGVYHTSVLPIHQKRELWAKMSDQVPDEVKLSGPALA